METVASVKRQHTYSPLTPLHIILSISANHKNIFYLWFHTAHLMEYSPEEISKELLSLAYLQCVSSNIFKDFVS